MINTANDTTGPSGEVWSGAWVRERLGVELVGDEELTGLLGLALRRNPKRAHLLVSNVLGKHVPQSPAVVYGHGFALGRRVRELLGEDGARAAVVLGYAETATGLGHSVADGVGEAPYLHSTRRPVEGVAPVGGFEAVAVDAAHPQRTGPAAPLRKRQRRIRREARGGVEVYPLP